MTAPSGGYGHLLGRPVHILRGTTYAGEWTLTVAEPAEGPPAGWLRISDGRRQWFAQPEDIFDTEEAAREAAHARRRPRRPRQPQPLYGDFAQLAAFHGVSTDGSGKRVSRRDGRTRQA